MEQLKFLTVGKSIHFGHAAMPDTCVWVCARVCSVPRYRASQHKTKKGSKHPVSHTLEKERQADRDKKMRKEKSPRKHKNREQTVEKQQKSFNISSEIIYLSTLWQQHSSGPNKPTRFSVMEAEQPRRCLV